MLKKEITYTNLNDQVQTENHYFNLTRAEIVEIDADYPDGLMEYLTIAMQSKNNGAVIKAFKDLILRSYGVKTPSGKFVKNQELRDAFMASEAYSVLFMELLSGEEAAANFVNAIIPKVPADTEKAPISVVPHG